MWWGRGASCAIGSGGLRSLSGPYPPLLAVVPFGTRGEEALRFDVWAEVCCCRVNAFALGGEGEMRSLTPGEAGAARREATLVRRDAGRRFLQLRAGERMSAAGVNELDA